ACPSRWTAPRLRTNALAGNIHVASQDLVDACLVTAPLVLEPVEHVGIDADRDRFFSWRPRHQWLGEHLVVQFWNVGVVDVLVAELIDSCQVALDSALSRGHWLSSLK